MASVRLRVQGPRRSLDATILGEHGCSPPALQFLAFASPKAILSALSNQPRLDLGAGIRS